MKNRFWTMLVILVLIITMSVTVVSAASDDSRMISYHPSLSISGSTASCEAIYYGQTDDNVKVTLTLKRGNARLNTWTASGQGFICMSESCTVTPGLTYTLVMNVTVNGVPKPSISVSAAGS